MCGIAGFSGTFERELLTHLGEAIAHRGPDAAGDGVYVTNGSRAGLANRRLAIQDLSPAGTQPMTLRCPACGCVDAPDHERLWLTFNGEIYNFPALRVELEQMGHRFFSRSDSEVILHLYAQHGRDMLSRLNGIFALAIYDGRPRGQQGDIMPGDVILARDGAGVKPLYYSQSRRGVLFASEIKALLRCDPHDVGRDLDPVAVAQYLAYQWVPAPRTVLSSVRKALPGESLILRRGRVASRSMSYFPRPRTDVSSKSLEVLVHEFRAELEAAVSRQLLSDVPVGAFLSGGLDSSAVVAMVRQARPDYRLPCYTMAFDDDFAGEGGPSDLPFARRVAAHLGVDLIEVAATPSIVDRLPEVLYALDEPTGDPAPINAYLIAERAGADGIKVLLSGTGGDDILGGYRRHLWLGTERFCDAIPPWARYPAAQWARLRGTSRATPFPPAVLKLLAQLDAPRPQRLASRLQQTQPGLRRRLLHRSILGALPPDAERAPLVATLAELPPEADPLTMMLHLEQRHFLADHNLNYLDKTTMAFGVEGRVPLLDLEFLRFAAAIPSRYKVSGRTTKYILKRAMEPLLPHDVIYRAKSGFGVPLRRWMATELRQMARDTLSPRRVRARGVFDDAAVQALINDTETGRVDGAYPLFSMMAFETWCARFLDETPAARTDAVAARAAADTAS